MNSQLSIEVRILVAQARAQINSLKSSLNSLSFGSASSGASGFGAALGKINLTSFGSRLQWVGRQIEYNFTLPIVAAATAATKLALDNESAMVRIQKVYGDGSQSAAQMANEINALSKAFVLLSDEFGVAQSDVLNIAADWAAAGVSGIALAKSVQLTLQTMILGEQNAADATTSLISIQAQYGLSISQLADTIDLLNMVENQTAVSMSGLIDAFTRSAGVAATSGVSVRYLAADIAAISPAAGSATTAGNALKTIFSRLQDPTSKVSDTLKDIGINTNSVAFQAANGQEKLLMVAKAFTTLNDAQKNFVATNLAGVYQVNRFNTLVNELNSSTGYYAKALAATSSQTAIYQQAQKELNQVLTSNPQRLKEIWVTLQNAMADIIQPLIPLVLYLAQSMQKLVTGFSNLNPAFQKFILFGLAALAFVGPVVRYVGAFATLAGQVGSGLSFVASAGAGVIGFLAKLIALPFVSFFSLFTSGMRVVGSITSTTLRALPGMWIATIQVIGSVWSAGMAAIEFITNAAQVAIITSTSIFSGVISAIWGLLETGIEEILIAGAARAGVIYRAGLVLIQDILISGAARIGVIWRLITLSPLVLLQSMWSGIVVLFTRGLVVLAEVGPAIIDALTGPIGIAITIVVALLIIFWDDIKKGFENVVSWFSGSSNKFASAFKPLADAVGSVRDFIMKAFNALPASIQSSMIAVVNTIAAAAKAIYGWFQHINPWTRHSPSHVDNVTSGVAEIKNQYNELKTVGVAFKAAKSDLDLFADAVRNVEHAAEANHYAEIRKEIIAVAKDALPYYDALVKQLYPLENQLAAVNKQLTVQQQVVDNLKDSLDAANDTLQAQSDVLDKMKDAADGFSDKVNALNGDIETLSGIRQSLQSAGAGSDILAGYDQQIKSLKDQKQGIDQQLSAAQAAYTSQKALVQQLTTARDALQATYDKENASLELIQKNYDAIKSKIDAITGAINDFDSAAQALSDAAKKKADPNALPTGGDYGSVVGGGKLGRELPGIPDQSSLIDGFTKNLSGSLSKMFGSFSILAPIKKAWNASTSWLISTFGPLGHVIGSLFSSTFSNLPNPFAKLDFSGYISGFENIMKGVGHFFEGFWKQIGPPIIQVGQLIGSEFLQAWKKITPEIEKFKNLVGPIGQLFKELAPVLKVIGAILGGVIVGAVIIVANVLKDALGPVLNWIIDIITAVIRILRGLIELLVGVFTGNWKLAWTGIKDIFSGIWLAIWSTIKNAALLIWGIIKGLVEGIWSFFKWIYDELLGHSIIPDIVNGLIFYFTLMKDVALAIWNLLVAGLKIVWNDVLKPIFQAIADIIQWVLAIFKLVVAGIKIEWGKFTDDVHKARDDFNAAIGKIKDIWNSVKDTAQGVYNTAKSWIDKFVSAILGIKTKIKNAFDGAFDGLETAFKSAVNWMIGKWNDFHLTIGGGSIAGVKIPSITLNTPNLPLLAKGGSIYGSATAIVGEGRPGYPEYVIPTDPLYRDRATMLFQALGGQLGVYRSTGNIMANVGNELRKQAGGRVSLFASGGLLGRGSIRTSGSGTVVVVSHHEDKSEYHFHGDLSFPNVKSGDDADEFIKNLRALVGG